MPATTDDLITIVLASGAVVRTLTPQPPQPFSAPDVPAAPTVTRRQALRALHEAGLLTGIEAAINSMPEPARSAARIDWDNAAEFRRDFPLLLQLAAAMGLTAAQIDSLFITANTV